jgi:hypothetical protein
MWGLWIRWGSCWARAVYQTIGPLWIFPDVDLPRGICPQKPVGSWEESSLQERGTMRLSSSGESRTGIGAGLDDLGGRLRSPVSSLRKLSAGRGGSLWNVREGHCLLWLWDRVPPISLILCHFVIAPCSLAHTGYTLSCLRAFAWDFNFSNMKTIPEHGCLDSHIWTDINILSFLLQNTASQKTTDIQIQRVEQPRGR